jgi:hypothetical protein
MNAPRIEKLKNVLEAVPSGFIVDSHWLETQGVSRFLTRRYIDSGWLERLGPRRLSATRTEIGTARLADLSAFPAAYHE